MTEGVSALSFSLYHCILVTHSPHKDLRPFGNVFRCDGKHGDAVRDSGGDSGGDGK